MASLMVILFNSCEDQFAEMSEIIGNEELPTVVERDTVYEYVEEVILKDSLIYVFIHDTLIVDNTTTDTLIVEKYDTTYIKGDTVINTVYDTVFVTRELEFNCYTFDEEGRIVASSTEGEPYVISYNLMIETSGDVYFTQETEEDFSLKNSRAEFSNSNSAYFTVSKGSEEVTLEVKAPGANSVIINNDEVIPCDYFEIEAEITELNDREINGKSYEVALISYSFYSIINGREVAAAETQQYLFAPKAVSEPENERVVTIEKYVDGGNLIVKGKIDNSILEDTTAQVSIPLTLSLACGTPQVVTGTNFKFNAGNNVNLVSETTVNTLALDNNSMVVSYEEVETVFNHTSTASGNTVITNQTTRHYDNFVVTFGGKEEVIELGSLSVYPQEKTEGSVNVTTGAQKTIVVPFKAEYAGLTATANQEITIVVEAIAFAGQRVVEAYRTISFNQHESCMVYDCVLTRSEDNSEHYFHYREIVNGVPQAWVSEKLTQENYEFITNKSYFLGQYALAVYYHRDVTGPRVGVLGDDINSENNEVIYHAFGKVKNSSTESEKVLPRKTVKGSRFSVFGKLNSAIAGTGVEEDGLIKLTTKVVTFGDQTVCQSSTVYFY